jgi:hypothetical protein
LIATSRPSPRRARKTIHAALAERPRHLVAAVDEVLLALRLLDHGLLAVVDRGDDHRALALREAPAHGGQPVGGVHELHVLGEDHGIERLGLLELVVFLEQARAAVADVVQFPRREPERFEIE